MACSFSVFCRAWEGRGRLLGFLILFIPFFVLVPVVVRRAALAHQLEEAAFFAVAGLLLIEERQVLLVKLLEEFLPGDRFQRFAATVAGEVDAQDPRLV